MDSPERRTDAILRACWIVSTSTGELKVRVAASLLKAIGLDEQITRTLAEYEALALRLARDLASPKSTLNRNRDTCLLFDRQSATRHIETAYRTMAHIARRHENPRSFKVERV